MGSIRLLAWSVVVAAMFPGCSSPPGQRGKPASVAPQTPVSAPVAATTRPVDADGAGAPREFDFTQPSQVTLHFQDAPAPDVYESLFKQAGASLSAWSKVRGPKWLRSGADANEPAARARPLRPGGGPTESTPRVTIDVDNVPFWQAFRALEKQTGLRVDRIGPDTELAETPFGIEMGGRVCMSGPFMMIAADDGEMTWKVNMFVEPRIKVLASNRFAKLIETVDANGRPVLPPKEWEPMFAAMRDRARDLDGDGGNAFEVQLPWPVPPQAARIRGTVQILAAAGERTLDITDIAPATDVDRNVDGEPYLVSVLNPAPGEWTVLLTMYGQEPSVYTLTRPSLLDAKGSALTRIEGEGMFTVGDRRDFEVGFRQAPTDGPPVKLTFLRTGRTVEIPIDAAKAKDAERVVNGQRVLVNVLNPVPGEWLVTVVSNDPTGSDEVRYELSDANGNALTFQAGTGTRVRYVQGPSCGPPAKLTLRMPAGAKEIDVPFSFDGNAGVAAR